MILALMFWLVCSPALYVAGSEFAIWKRMRTPEIWGGLAALVPPFGAFCAVAFIMSNYEEEE